MPRTWRSRSTVLLLVALTATGCAAPGASEPGVTASSSPAGASPSGSAAAPPSASATASASGGTPTGSTAIEPTVSVPPTVSPKAGQEQFPPLLVLGPIKEAGTGSATLDGVTIQTPGGFAQTSTAPPTFTGTGPATGRTGTITLSSTAAQSTDAIAELKTVAPAARFGKVTIPHALDAAMSEAISDGVQTWRLLVITPAKRAVTVAVAAPPAAYDDLLLVQSLSSIEIAA
ncbi:hypothetical protein [Cumulibacter manganitolerans]|uniref:hypothetical protein n=1 Tax=Cumulibacter manganitolerans TaxID=1884992 RepID=UPI0012948C16|nr:hypothetical protein [Cumulibacter manganitolerans]